MGKTAGRGRVRNARGHTGYGGLDETSLLVEAGAGSIGDGNDADAEFGLRRPKRRPKAAKGAVVLTGIPTQKHHKHKPSVSRPRRAVRDEVAYTEKGSEMKPYKDYWGKTYIVTRHENGVAEAIAMDCAGLALIKVNMRNYVLNPLDYDPLKAILKFREAAQKFGCTAEAAKALGLPGAVPMPMPFLTEEDIHA